MMILDTIRSIRLINKGVSNMGRRTEIRKKNKYVLDNMEKETINVGELLIKLGLIEVISYEEYMENPADSEAVLYFHRHSLSESDCTAERQTQFFFS